MANDVVAGVVEGTQEPENQRQRGAEVLRLARDRIVPGMEADIVLVNRLAEQGSPRATVVAETSPGGVARMIVEDMALEEFGHTQLARPEASGAAHRREIQRQ